MEQMGGKITAGYEDGILEDPDTCRIKLQVSGSFFMDACPNDAG